MKNGGAAPGDPSLPKGPYGAAAQGLKTEAAASEHRQVLSSGSNRKKARGLCLFSCPIHENLYTKCLSPWPKRPFGDKPLLKNHTTRDEVHLPPPEGESDISREGGRGN